MYSASGPPDLTGKGHVRCPYYLRRHGAEAQCSGYPHGYAPEGCKKVLAVMHFITAETLNASN